MKIGPLPKLFWFLLGLGAWLVCRLGALASSAQRADWSEEPHEKAMSRQTKSLQTKQRGKEEG